MEEAVATADTSSAGATAPFLYLKSGSQMPSTHSLKLLILFR